MILVNSTCFSDFKNFVSIVWNVIKIYCLHLQNNVFIIAYKTEFDGDNVRLYQPGVSKCHQIDLMKACAC